MELDDWLARIERLHPREIELGLGRIRLVAERLGVVAFDCPVVTVAGTNGKGSTVTLIERLARAAGRRTALYTSPHLFRFNERIRLDGEPLDDASLCRAFEQVEQARAEVALTYFEFTTLAAFWLFRQARPDLVVLEVGLGGRLDAVNLMDADVAVITSIGLDHQDWLGHDRNQIGREKAGILRPGRPLLFAALDMPASIGEAADQGQAVLMRAGREFGFNDGQLFWHQNGVTRTQPLPASVALGEDNLAAAVQALALLQALPEDWTELACQARLAGRCQRIPVNGVDWYFDVGHNREALQRFRQLLPAPVGRRRALCAMLADKPAGEVLADFASSVDHWYLAALGGPRARTAESLQALLSGAGQCFVSVADAVVALKEAQQPGDQVLVFGSFHTVAEAAEAAGVTLT
jgi:dihydrofolate synthase / folylpolyglutamate synthase